MVSGAWGGITHPLPKLKAAPLECHAHSQMCIWLRNGWLGWVLLSLGGMCILGTIPQQSDSLTCNGGKHLLGLQVAHNAPALSDTEGLF